MFDAHDLCYLRLFKVLAENDEVALGRNVFVSTMDIGAELSSILFGSFLGG
jgi:hypothetical protein